MRATSDMSAIAAAKLGQLVPAYRAARIVAASPSTLRRWAAEKRIRQFTHPMRTGYFYLRREMDEIRDGFAEVDR